MAPQVTPLSLFLMESAVYLQPSSFSQLGCFFTAAVSLSVLTFNVAYAGSTVSIFNLLSGLDAIFHALLPQFLSVICVTLRVFAEGFS